MALRWFADMRHDHTPCNDAQLAKTWRFLFANTEALKQGLLDAGVLEAVAGGVAKYGLVVS